MPGHRFALMLFAACLAGAVAILVAMAWMARLPDQAQGKMLAVFPPTMEARDIFAALTRAGAQPVRDTGLGFVWVVQMEQPAIVASLRREGALGAYRELPFSPQLSGCAVYADAQVRQFFTVRP